MGLLGLGFELGRRERLGFWGGGTTTEGMLSMEYTNSM